MPPPKPDDMHETVISGAESDDHTAMDSEAEDTLIQEATDDTELGHEGTESEDFKRIQAQLAKKTEDYGRIYAKYLDAKKRATELERELSAIRDAEAQAQEITYTMQEQEMSEGAMDVEMQFSSDFPPVQNDTELLQKPDASPASIDPDCFTVTLATLCNTNLTDNTKAKLYDELLARYETAVKEVCTFLKDREDVKNSGQTTESMGPVGEGESVITRREAKLNELGNFELQDALNQIGDLETQLLEQATRLKDQETELRDKTLAHTTLVQNYISFKRNSATRDFDQLHIARAQVNDLEAKLRDKTQEYDALLANHQQPTGFSCSSGFPGDDLQEELEEVKEVARGRREEIENLEHKLRFIFEDANRRLREADSEANDLREKITELQDTNHLLNAKWESLEGEQGYLAVEKSQAIFVVTQYEERCDKRDVELDAREKAVKIAEEEMRDMKMELEQRERGLDVLRQYLPEDIATENIKLKKQLADALSAAEAETSLNQVTKVQAAEQQTQLLKLSFEQLEEYRARVAQLETQMDQLKSWNERLVASALPAPFPGNAVVVDNGAGEEGIPCPPAHWNDTTGNTVIDLDSKILGLNSLQPPTSSFVADEGMRDLNEKLQQGHDVPGYRQRWNLCGTGCSDLSKLLPLFKVPEQTGSVGNPIQVDNHEPGQAGTQGNPVQVDERSTFLSSENNEPAARIVAGPISQMNNIEKLVSNPSTPADILDKDRGSRTQAEIPAMDPPTTEPHHISTSHMDQLENSILMSGSVPVPGFYLGWPDLHPARFKAPVTWTGQVANPGGVVGQGEVVGVPYAIHTEGLGVGDGDERVSEMKNKVRFSELSVEDDENDDMEM